MHSLDQWKGLSNSEGWINTTQSQGKRKIVVAFEAEEGGAMPRRAAKQCFMTSDRRESTAGETTWYAFQTSEPGGPSLRDR